jgi:transposase-like protein
MTKRRKRVFSAEFKREAVKLVNTGDKPATQIARELGIPQSSLYRWVEQATANVNEETTALSTSELEELKQLRKDKARLEMEVEILGKATAFFAKRNH